MKNYKSKCYLLVVLLAILFVSCQEEEVLLTTKDGYEQVFRKTSIDDNDELREMISWFGKPGSNARSSYVNTEMGLLDLNEIIERVALESQQAPNYTIRLIPPDSVQGTAEWLVLAHRPSGYVGYILQIEPEGGSSSGLEDLTGFMRILNFDRIIRSENYFENGLITGKPSSNHNGRGEDETLNQQCYSNCDCHYELGDAGAGDPINSSATGNQWDPSGESQGMNVYNIVCDCDQVNCSAGGGGPGSGGSSGGTYGGGGPTTGGGGNIGVGTPIGGGGIGGGLGGSSGGTTGGSSGSSGGSTGSGSGDSNDNSNSDPIGLDFSEIDLRCVNEGGGIMINGVCMTEEEYFAVETLNLLLEEDPFALIQDIDCEELEKWKEVANTPVPQAVIDRLEALEATTTNDTWDNFWTNNDWAIQDLADAGGAVINMDYFSVNIDQLPTGMSAQDLFEHIRTDLFFETLDNTTFSPHPLFDNTNPEWTDIPAIGSIFSIDIDFPANDGSVVCIDHDTYSWTFATISDPYNLSHPVSGNRMFGLEPNGNGGYTFFTRGMDRAVDGLSGFVRDAVNATNIYDLLDEGSRPWNALQDKIKEFVNVNNGIAEEGNEFNERPYFEDIEDFLNGQKTLEEVRNTIPCN